MSERVLPPGATRDSIPPAASPVAGAISRRRVVGAAGAAVAIPALTNSPAAWAGPDRQPVVSTRDLEIRFDAATGLPASYRLPKLREQLLGAESEELRRAQWQYQGGRNSAEYGHDIHVTTVDGASFEITFTGTGIEYVTDLNTDKGKIEIQLDGQVVETVDAYHPTRVWQSSVFSATGLPPGQHTLKGVKISGEYAIVDAFIIHGADGAVTINDNGTGITYSQEVGFERNLGAVVTRMSTREQIRAGVTLLAITTDRRRARAAYRVVVGDTLAATFTLSYDVDDATVEVALTGVKERTGWELVEVHTPSLITVSTADRAAWLAHGDSGGLLAPLSSALESSLPYGTRGAFPNLSILPLVLLGTARAAVAVEIPGYLTNTALNVYDRDGEKRASVGAVTLYRVPGGAETPSLLVHQPEIARLDFVGDVDRNGSIDWLDAAKTYQKRVPKSPTDYYDDKFLYALQGQVGPTDRTEPRCTFAQAEVLVERVSSLLDGNPQVVFMAGWPEGGHDTSYPAVDTVNPELGGKAGWDKLQTVGRKHHNANITLDDNWDDQYDNAYTTGVFDESYITRTSDGELERHMAWNGVDLSYITGFAKYMSRGGPGRERARFTIDHYGLRHAVLIDGMSWWSIRNDWDPAHPASAVDNLRHGKFTVIEEYAKRGVHVGSELLRFPFVGKIAFVMDGPTGGGWNGFGGTSIPLLALVLRESTTYGINSGGSPDARTTLFHNNRTHTWLEPSTPDTKITDLYYLNYLPWMQLHDRPIRTFDRTDRVSTIGFDQTTSVTIDESKETQRVVLSGVTIMDGDTVTIPMDDHRIAFYATTATTLSYPLPRGVREARLRGRRLTGTEHYPHPVTVVDQMITVDVPARQPVIVSTHSDERN